MIKRNSLLSFEVQLVLSYFSGAKVSAKDLHAHMRHENVVIRHKIATYPYTPPDILLQMALTDPSEWVRLAAIERLDVIDLLGE